MHHFSSLHTYHAPLADLVGADAASDHLQAWITQQLARIDDPAFAAQFDGFYPWFGAAPEAYNQRIFEHGTGTALGGIRFYGGDPKRPFVDVVAWDGDLDPARLCAAVREQWRVFEPFAMRLTLRAGRRPGAAYVDQHVYAARADAMTAPADGVRLEAADDPGAALHLVTTRHAEIAQADPLLAAELTAADTEDLAQCKKNGTLHFIVADRQRVGVLATEPDRIEFVAGNKIVEEVVLAAFNGRGLAAKAQAVLALHLRKNAPEALIIGTIQRTNQASIRTADRAGRKCVFDYVFIDC